MPTDNNLNTTNEYLKQLSLISKNVNIQSSSTKRMLQKSFESFSKSMLSASSLKNTLGLNMENIIKPSFDYCSPFVIFLKEQKKMDESMGLLYKQYVETINRTFSDFQKTLDAQISNAFEQIQNAFKELNPRTQKALLLLAEHGWYFDLKIPHRGLIKLTNALSDGNISEVEQALSEYFEEHLDEIETSISEKFPHRSHLIKSALKAHQRQEYELSIPVLLAQTDGICFEVASESLFRKENKNPRTAKFVKQVASDTFWAALLSPLANTIPINQSEKERPANFVELNRHMVLHGESLDYGTKINSLKTISLINYVAHVLTFDKKANA